MAGKHGRAAQRCNHCHKAEGDPVGDGTDSTVTLLIDLEEYPDKDRIFQGARTPDNPLPQFLVWCSACAGRMIHEGDPITNFREIGYPDNSAKGPYAQELHQHGRGFRWGKKPGDPPAPR